MEKNFVGIGVANSAEEPWISESALERVIGGGEHSAKLVERDGKDIEAAGIERGQAGFSTDEMQRCTLSRAGFG